MVGKAFKKMCLAALFVSYFKMHRIMAGIITTYRLLHFGDYSSSSLAPTPLNCARVAK